jgi:hypothetical protein
MSELWGYKIATKSNAKIYRRSYRATKSDQACLISVSTVDVSCLLYFSTALKNCLG